MKTKFDKSAIDLNKITTYSIKDRKSKVNISSFSNVSKWRNGGSCFADILPGILKANDLKSIVEKVVLAYENKKPVIFAMGAHVIKCGLNPLIIDLLDKGVVTGIALNGAGIVHDYETAYNGSTSEDVSSEIGAGTFGMAKETGEMLNVAINENVNSEIGLGESIGMDIENKDLKYKNLSLLYSCYKRDIPITVHVALGTDIIHLHPTFDPAKAGIGTFNDFKLFSSMVSKINDGGCYFNIGSSVILPEIFLKALTLTRNLGFNVNNFTTVNMDMIQHYRPNVNVVSRPTQNSGHGFSITGHHEIMIPLFYTMIMDALEKMHK